MSKARDLQLQLAKTLLLDKEAPAAKVIAPFKRDRMQLSQDLLVARALREPATEVHKRNPRTTYLSQIESMMSLIEDVSETQEALKTEAKNGAKKKSPPGKSKWSNSKSGNVSGSGKGKKPLRKASLPKPRTASAGGSVIK
jgi:hypothetical protein